MSSLNKKDLLVIEEYFQNGFNQTKAYSKIFKTKNYNASKTNASVFFNREDVKSYIEERMSGLLGDYQQVTDKLLIYLQQSIFEREIDGAYTYNHKLKEMELLLKVMTMHKDSGLVFPKVVIIDDIG